MSSEFYHCRLKPISRSAGRSAVACAAYRAGLALQDERYGTLRDFTAKKDVVTHFTLAPEGAPDWARDTAELWNRVEAKENRINSTLAFEWEIALPNELDHAQREAIARKFAGWICDEYGAAVSVGIHEGGSRGNGLNDHMHCMMTSRGLNERGWEKNKFRDFNTAPGMKNPEVERVREHVADLINDALEEAGSETRVDHRSFTARGITDREPTKHLGPKVTARERRGIETDRGDINRAIIEQRLVWQQGEAQPEITAALEREFAARFGDEPRPGLSAEPPAAPEELTPEPPSRDDLQAEPVSTAQAGEPRRTTPWGRAWRAFADRARSFAARVAELWNGEDSEAEPDSLQPAPQPDRDATPAQNEGGLWQAFVKAERVVTQTASSLWRSERGSVPDLSRALFEAFQADAEAETESPRFESPEPATRAPQAPAPAPDRDEIDLG